jgi:hypothetical protein
VLQTWLPPHWAEEVQLPEVHAPPLQTWFVPYAVVQSELMLQTPHSLPLQICVALLQSGAVRQSPVTQRLLRQMWFAPTLGSFKQALSLAQAPHSWEVGSQICPPVQVLVSWQLPLIHTPPEQM